MPGKPWELLHRLADEAYPGLLQAALEAAAAIPTSAAFARKLRDALAAGDQQTATSALVEALTSGSAEYRTAIQVRLVEVFVEFTDPAIAASSMPAGITAHFNLTNPRVFGWINQASDEFLAALAGNAKAAVQEVAAAGFALGHPPAQMARQLLSVASLPPNYAAAVLKFEAELNRLLEDGADPVPKWVLDRIDFIGGKKKKFGLTPERIRRLVDAYADRLRLHVATTWARTVTIQASAEAQRELWRQAVESELLSETQWLVKWIITPDDRLCPYCLAMDGQRRTIHGAYPNGSSGPTLHPQCRCAEGLVRV